jgi:hypothetical protein
MRWIAVITAINAVAIALLLTISNYFKAGVAFSWSGLIFFTAIIVIFGLFGGLTLGFIGLLLSRRFAPGSVWALLAVGAVFGALAGWVLDSPGQRFWLIGLLLGALSAAQWWYFVERHPDRRAYFD